MEMIADPVNELTPRMLEFLALYASGHELRQIAEIKFVSYQVVQQTLADARRRTRAKTLAHLCAMAVESRVIVRNGVGYKPVQDERVVGE
jgi:DNA-binding CsgD family transcriptional regulator